MNNTRSPENQLRREFRVYKDQFTRCAAPWLAVVEECIMPTAAREIMMRQRQWKITRSAQSKTAATLFKRQQPLAAGMRRCMHVCAESEPVVIAASRALRLLQIVWWEDAAGAAVSHLAARSISAMRMPCFRDSAAAQYTYTILPLNQRDSWLPHSPIRVRKNGAFQTGRLSLLVIWSTESLSGIKIKSGGRSVYLSPP